MNDNDIQLRIETGKIRYTDLKTTINFMYNFCDGKSIGTLEEIIEGYDNYIQAMLLAQGLSDGNLVEKEIEFIMNISDHNNFSKNIKLENYNNFTEDEQKIVYKECQKVIEQVPLFVKLSVTADKYASSKAIDNKPTFSQFTFDKLKRLSTYLQFCDLDVQPSEETGLRKILEPVIDYYKKSYVKYSTERKKKGEK